MWEMVGYLMMDGDNDSEEIMEHCVEFDEKDVFCSIIVDVFCSS